MFDLVVFAIHFSLENDSHMGGESNNKYSITHLKNTQLN